MEILSSPFVLVIAGLIIMLLGIGAGMLISSLSEENEPEADLAEQTPPGGRKGRYLPIVRLWRERESGSLIVEMDGKSFVAADAVAADRRGELESAARDLRAWLGMGMTAPAEIAPSVPPMQNGTPVPVQPISNPAPVGRPAAVSSPVSTPAAAPAAVPGLEDTAGIAPEQKSIVMQIEDILQDMLEGTALAAKGIHLIEDPLKGVIVRIGISHYEGIDAVPDPEIKSFIRAAVSEWEKTQ